MKQIDEEELRRRLREETELGGVQNWADAYQFHASFVYDVLRGVKLPSDKLSRALGYRRVVRFEKVEVSE